MLWEFEDAMHRLVQRKHPEHFAAPLKYCDQLPTFQNDSECRRAEVVRAESNGVTHTGAFLTFELVTEEVWDNE